MVFRLLELPCELRLKIYGFALTSSHPLELPHPAKGIIDLTQDRADDNYDALNVAVLRLNRVVYKEACPIFYGDNVFLISDLQAAEDALEPLLPSKRLVKHLQIRAHNLYDHFHDLVKYEIRYFANLRHLLIRLPGGKDRDMKTADSYIPGSVTRVMWALPRKARIEFTGVGQHWGDSLNQIERLDKYPYAPFDEDYRQPVWRGHERQGAIGESPIRDITRCNIILGS